MENEIKHKRGGKKGNQNARKHGFYSRALSPAELCDFFNLINLKGIDREVAVVDVKLKSLLEQDPGNRRVILEAAKLLAGIYASKYRLTGTHKTFLQQFIPQILTAKVRNEPLNLSGLPFLQNESGVNSAPDDSFSALLSREKAGFEK